ncbi:Subtilase family protein [Striga hermonthica]|uniref:Subtilase family protein n=1 Tax=Striga hermonthica TaxID=68872 RepID=A0A9N7RK47_STRHE|nr:Subtilase family protein [Striga hermonthica]
MKPSVFVEVRHWYQATLESLQDSSNYNNNNPSNSSKLVHVYDTVFHGFSAKLTPRQAQQLEEWPGVVSVFPDRVYNLHTTRTPYFMGLYGDTYNTVAGPLLYESDYGSNVIIGFLDDGIKPDHPSFNDGGLIPLKDDKRWKGECAVNGSRYCNNKLFGVRYITKGMDGGHGTHTASTAAGRAVKNVFYSEDASGTAVGVAPKARIVSYRVCDVYGCSSSDILAGFDMAVKDGPDVLAPGVNILAAWPEGVEFKLLSGTSMACAHVSGLAALLKGVHPDWSPAMIRSAIMTTAYTRSNNRKPIINDHDGKESTTADMGAGHIAPGKASDPGLVYDITPQEYYVYFMCASNYTGYETNGPFNCSEIRPWDLNNPAISIDWHSLSHNNDITVNRTVTNVGEVNSCYTATMTNPRGVNLTVNPMRMDFTSKGEKKSYSVTITAAELLGDNVEGKIVWSDGKRQVVSHVVIVNTRN